MSQALTECRIDSSCGTLIKHICENPTASMRLHEYTTKFRIQKGVCKVDAISPKLFTTLLKSVFKRLNFIHKGKNIDDERLYHLRFDNDVLLIVDSIGDIKEMLYMSSEEVGLQNLHRLKTY